MRRRLLALVWVLGTLGGTVAGHCVGFFQALSRRFWKPKPSGPLPPVHPACRCVVLPVDPVPPVDPDATMCAPRGLQ